jgi:hypothetical protein
MQRHHLTTMAADKFTIETAAGNLLCVKVYPQPNRFFLYILPHNTRHRGFFMTRGNSGNWEILYKILVEKSIIEIEADIAAIIDQALRG